MEKSRKRVAFERFGGIFISWQDLLQQAADFAASVERDDLISISHSSDNNVGVVVVWYWKEQDKVFDL